MSADGAARTTSARVNDGSSAALGQVPGGELAEP
jgi:hypothetical protein